MKERSAVWQFALSGLVSVLVIALIAVLAFRAIARQQALDDAKDLARLTAAAVIEPSLTIGVERGQPAAVARFNDVLRRSVLTNTDIVRIKVWSPDGEILYSDEPRAIGMTFPEKGKELAGLADGEVEAEVSDLEAPENEFERGQGELVEVYMPVTAPDGGRVLFESYQPAAAISETTRELTRAFIPALIGGLILLQLVNLPLARRLVNRVRRAREEREEYLQAAMNASDRERRRIAADLHDGLVQDMNGLSLSIAAEARAVRAGGDKEGAARLEEISASGRQLTRGLRNALVDIYPPTLHRQGLVAALSDLVENMNRRGIDASLESDQPIELAPDVEALLFRVAQESTRNVISHAAASSLRITLAQEPAGTTTLVVADDGRGFDENSPEASPEGHFGMKAMKSLTSDAGGTFKVKTAPGDGTEIRVEVPNS